jgi:hypothetical protein
MIYLIFTADGFKQALPDITADEALLWVNDNVLTELDKLTLASEKIEFFILPTPVEPNNERSVVAAIEYVEKTSPNTEILVEYL